MATITKRDLKKLRKHVDAALTTVKDEVSKLADFINAMAGDGVNRFREVYLDRKPAVTSKECTNKPRIRHRRGSK